MLHFNLPNQSVFAKKHQINVTNPVLDESKAYMVDVLANYTGALISKSVLKLDLDAFNPSNRNRPNASIRIYYI